MEKEYLSDEQWRESHFENLKEEFELKKELFFKENNSEYVVNTINSIEEAIKEKDFERLFNECLNLSEKIRDTDDIKDHALEIVCACNEEEEEVA